MTDPRFYEHCNRFLSICECGRDVKFYIGVKDKTGQSVLLTSKQIKKLIDYLIRIGK